MKATLSLITAITAAAILMGCGTTKSHRDYSGIPAAKIDVTVSCSNPATKFEGTIVSDGHSEPFNGVGSGTFHATGHELICSFKKTGGEGQISISVSEAGNNLGNAYTGQKFGGVRAEIVRTAVGPHQTFSTF
jgi:hypothetical protein